MNEQHYLRINGTITMDIPYISRHGFETPLVPRCFPRESDPHAPAGYSIAITDLHGKQYWEGMPILDGGNNDAPGRWSLSGYIPLLVTPGFYEIRRYQEVIYQGAIAENAPVIKITKWKPSKKNASIAWEAHAGVTKQEGNQELLFTAACIVASKTFPLLFKSTATSLEFDLSKIPGASEARIAVRAGDGVRSSVATTEPFAIPAKPPIVRILQPAADSVFNGTEPISVAGFARDVAGVNIPFSNLQWFIEPGEDVPTQNNSAIIQTRRALLHNEHGQLVLSNLSPGKHHIRLLWQDSMETVETSVSITVRPMDQWEKEWKALFAT